MEKTVGCVCWRDSLLTHYVKKGGEKYLRFVYLTRRRSSLRSSQLAELEIFFFDNIYICLKSFSGAQTRLESSKK